MRRGDPIAGTHMRNAREDALCARMSGREARTVRCDACSKICATSLRKSGMQFNFTEEQQAFADSVRRFALTHLEKEALKRAHDPRYPFDVAKLMSAQGLMGISLPEADGGQGGTLMDAVIAIEQVAAVCPRSADVVQFGNFGPIRTFAEYATSQQKARWLHDLLQGRMVMSLGITEPDAGSAATDLKTSAKPDGSHYVINGSKLFSSFSPDAAIFLIYVRYGAGLGGIGSVVLERGARRRCRRQH